MKDLQLISNGVLWTAAVKGTKKHMLLTITGYNTILLSHLNVRTNTVLMTNLNNRHIYIYNKPIT